MSKGAVKHCSDCAFCAEAYPAMEEYCELPEYYINNVEAHICKHFVDLNTCKDSYTELLKRMQGEIAKTSAFSA